MSSETTAKRTAQPADKPAPPAQGLINEGLALLRIGGLYRDGRVSKRTVESQLRRIRRRLRKRSEELSTNG